jgi:hypothetical protein
LADAERVHEAKGIKNFLQGFAENGAEFWRCFAGDDIFAKTKKDAMIASLHVKL